MVPGPLHRFFEADHRRLDDLLRRSTAGAGAVDPALFDVFRAGLLRHIGMEEKRLFPAARAARGSEALPIAARLRVDHGALAALLVPTPTPGIVAQILSVLAPHNRREEEPGGAYDVCDLALGSREAERLASELSAFPEPPLKAYNDAPEVFRHIEANLALSRRQWAGAGPDVDAYAVLAREHRLIERVLAALGQVCSRALREKRLDAGAAALAIRFLREFADRTHHVKEEEVLFPAIEARGFFPGCGLVREHEEGRERVRSLGEAVEAASSGDVEAVRLFVRRARSYVTFLRDHIAKEDDCLADVVSATLSAEERRRLVREFDETERREIGEHAFERFVAVAEELEASAAPHPDPPRNVPS